MKQKKNEKNVISVTNFSNWEHAKKTFATHSRIWLLRRWGSLSESIIKGSVIKIICSNNNE